VHDYLNQSGGAERVLGALHRLFPDAPIFTTIVDRRVLWPDLRDADIRTSWMQRLPGVLRHFRRYLLCYPFAIESLELGEYDLVISSSSAFAKGVRTRTDAVHVCYCHNPMRFVWEYDRYVRRERLGWITRSVLPVAIRWLRRWDLRAAQRPTLLIANSSVVADRIRRYYGRASTVVFPPVTIAAGALPAGPGEYYLIVSRLNPYKRIDLAVDAFTRLGLPLVIVGDGPDRPELERRAGPNVRFRGALPDAELATCYARCRGLVLPGEEDFGLVPLEANGAGRPVVAFHAGGALDTVVSGRTGVFFHEQSVPALCDAVARCEATSWDPAVIRAHAQQFSEAVFAERLREVLRGLVPEIELGVPKERYPPPAPHPAR
jgi:glycosyltransferase involved in cell wall biosynthesis